MTDCHSSMAIFLRAAIADDAGVVDQAVEPAEVRRHLLDHRLDLVGLGDVGRVEAGGAARGRDGGGHLFGVAAVAAFGIGEVVDRDGRAGLAESGRGASPQAARRAGNEIDFACKVNIDHGALLGGLCSRIGTGGRIRNERLAGKLTCAGRH